MKNNLFLLLCFFWSLYSFGQGGTVTIEGQILGYKGNKSIGYRLNDYFMLDNFARVKPDSLGRFVIKKEINGTSFFSVIYRDSTTYHSCKLIVEPGNHYTFISKGRDKYDLKHNTPDIYSQFKKENATFFKRDLGQMYYNLIDNNTRGDLYRDDWDLMCPDSLIPTLKKRINTQLSIFNNLFASGEINKKFFEIAKLNVEYTQAYRLAETIGPAFGDRYKINDSIILKKLLEIYPRIFEMYPVNKNINLQFYHDFDKYVDLYLFYLSDCETGKFIPNSKKGAAALEPLMHSEEHLNEQAYSTYSFIQAMNNMAMYGINAGDYGREIIRNHPDMNKEIRDTYEALLESVDKFDKLAYVDFPENIIILDEKAPINSFRQLQNILANQPALVDLWATWCMPCRGQFRFQDILKPFLKKYGIKMVYIAFEYGDTRKTWGNIIKGYKLEGYHFISNDKFTNDLKRYTDTISKIPTYLIIDSKGNIVETDAYPPSESDQLINQLKQKLNL